jgi:hypothetical protein
VAHLGQRGIEALLAEGADLVALLAAVGDAAPTG